MITDNASAKAIRTARRERVWDLRLQGKSERDIATEIGTVSNVTIHNDLVHLIREATKHLDDKVKAERIYQLHQLHLVVKEAFEAWQESKKTGGQIVEKTLPATEKYPGGRTEKIVTQYKQTGNPAYLSLVVTTLESIRKLFGLDAFKDDWEGELKAAGYNPAEIFETMVQSAYHAMSDKEEVKDDGSDKLDKLDSKTI